MEGKNREFARPLERKKHPKCPPPREGEKTRNLHPIREGVKTRKMRPDLSVVKKGNGANLWELYESIKLRPYLYIRKNSRSHNKLA